jgi:uncharacterized membrane protein
MVALVGMISGLAALPLVPSLNPEARPWLAVSALVHNLYYIFLQRAYAHGDLSQAYPLAPGLAPIIVMVLSAAVAQEFFHKVIGVALVSCGVIILASASGTGRSMLKASGYAMATACSSAPTRYLMAWG